MLRFNERKCNEYTKSNDKNLQKWYSKNVRRGNLLLNFFAADISGTR